MIKITSRRGRQAALAIVPIAALSLLAGGASSAFAQGGTAKPPKGAIPPFSTPNLPNPTPGQLGAPVANLHGFDDTGFIQSATVDAADANGNDPLCPAVGAKPARFGGTIKLNHGTVVVPCNLVVQMPANTMTWSDFVNGPAGGLANNGLEARVVGNIVGPRRLAGLIYISQHSANTSTGVITSINYATGDLMVDTGSGPAARVQINDPNGRFGRVQTPDARFSVDDVNPTIHAATGYPMCVPRTDPTVADDALCPQANRPNLVAVTVNGAQVPAVAGGCRTFGVAGIPAPASGDLSAPAAGQTYCSQYVMNSVAGRAGTDPDPRQQAPFEVGDSLTFAGTQVSDGAGPYVSAHTIEANVGIYTQAGTQPSYLAIGEFGVGTIDPNTPTIGVGAAETADRMFLEAETTDVKQAVDIYMVDIDPLTGAVRNRWTTPFAMTGEQNGPLQADGVTPIGGGITTQNTGPQPQRARIRTAKAPALLLSQATRTMRVAVRSKCVPQAPVNDAAGNPVLTVLDTCLNNTATTVANGLVAGEYTAPVFEYIFPENVKPGDPLIPFDFWHLPALTKGEGATTAAPMTPGVGPLDPKPW